MLLSEAIQYFHDARIGIIADTTQGWYRPRLGSLLDFLGDVEINTIKLSHLRRWRTSLFGKESRWDNHPHRPEEQGGLSQLTLHGYVRAARAFFSWLEKEQDDEGEAILEKNPARLLKLPPKPDNPPRDISFQDALTIISAAESNARDYAILRFLADTGCRVGGVAGLRMEHLGLSPGAGGFYRATVWEKSRGGKMKSRTVYYDQVTAQALGAYIMKHRPKVDTDYVFISIQPGRPNSLGEGGIYQMIRRYAKDLDIKGRWNPHARRHTFAHGLLDNGADLSLVSQLMGHSGIKVTADTYGRRADRVLAAHHAEYSWLKTANGSNAQLRHMHLPAPANSFAMFE